MSGKRALDTTIEVVTPENIAFDYQLAGPFRRLPAFLMDFVVRWCLIVLILLPLYLSGLFLNVFAFGPFLIAATFLIYFVISWFYGTLMETYFNGRTVGKWITGIRVIEVDGRPVTGRGALLRNLLRIADLAPMYAISNVSPDVPPIYMIPTGMVALLSMLLTRRMQRLGDLAAGTMVVIDEKRWRAPVDSVDDPRVPALATYLPLDLRISRSLARALAVYVERRSQLTPTRRRRIAKHLIDPMLDEINFRPDIDPDLMMYTLYYHAFLKPDRSGDLHQEEVDLSSLRGSSPLRHTVQLRTGENRDSGLENEETEGAAVLAAQSSGGHGFLEKASGHLGDADLTDEAEISG